MPDIKHLSKESKDALFLMVVKGLNYLMPLIIVPYLILKLGATGYGYIGFALAYVLYFTLIVDFGFELSASKRIIEASSVEESLRTRVFSSTVYAKLMLFGVSLIPYFLLPVVIPSISRYATTIYAMLPWLIGQTITFAWYYQSIGKIKIVAAITGISRIAILPLIFFFVHSPADYNIAALIQSSVVLLSGILSVIYLHYSKSLRFCKVSTSEIKRELKEAWPLFLSSVATSLYTKLFTLILGFLSTPAVVGLYSAAERIVRTICIGLYAPVIQAFFPKVARLALSDIQQARRLCLKIMRYLVGALSVICIVLFIFAPAISTFLGSDYDGITSLLRIMAFLPVVIATGGIIGQLGLIGLGNYETKKDFNRVYIIAGIISIISISILAPLLLAEGAAIALAITEISVTCLMFWYLYKNRLFTSR